MTDMISENDKTETFSINDDETQTFNPEIDTTGNRSKQTELPKIQTASFQSSNDLNSSKVANAEEIRKKLKYMEHILDIEN